MTDKVNIEKKGWRVNEISKAYGLSVGFLRGEIRDGRLPFKKLGSIVLILDEDLQKYLGSK